MEKDILLLDVWPYANIKPESESSEKLKKALEEGYTITSSHRMSGQNSIFYTLERIRK